MYQFVCNVLLDKRNFYVFDSIEQLRTELQHNPTKIKVTDFGAGVSGKIIKTRSIKSIAKKAAKNKKWGQLLFRIANYFEATSTLEMGTSLGISTLYLSSVSLENKTTTMEGCPQTASMAEQNFEKLNQTNIELIVGSFEENLSRVFNTTKIYDLIFIDGNHRYEPTLKYFEEALKCITNKSIIIFDDIHWSSEMKMAWEKIILHPRATVSIDLFQIGIVFFHQTQAKENFILQY